MRRVLAVFLSSTVLAGTAGPLAAQEAVDGAGLAAAEDATLLDTIVISGEKFERDYTRIYSSVGVVTGTEIENYQVDDLRKSFDRLGNVRWFDRGGSNNGFTIRGINSEGVTQPSNNAPVASVIIDGATQSVEGVRRGSRSLWDVKQVEVYRGPQSTLQGRAALAGAVVVETNDPSYAWEAALQGTAAEDDRLEGAFMVSGPLGNQAAFRLAGEISRSEKDIAYTFPRNGVLAEDEFRTLRGKLLLEPDALPGFSALLTISHTIDNPANAKVNAPFHNRVFTDGTFVEIREAENNNYIANLRYEVDDTLTLQSVSSFIDTGLGISSPPADLVQRSESRRDHNFTQDLRALIGTDDSRLSGVVGAFYGNFDYATDSLITADAFLAGLAPATGLATLTVQDQDYTNRTENLSAYADLRLRLGAHWSLLGGARLMHERVHNTATGTGIDLATFAPVVYSVNDTVEDTVLLPSFGVAYDFSDTQSVALTAKRGYRSGFTEVVQTTGGPNKVRPETLWSYEIAYRARAQDSRWTFGANAFYYDYKDQQIPVNVVAGPTPFVRTVNAGSATSYGAEIEGRYAFDNGLSVYGSLGLLETRFDRLVTDRGDFSGNSFPDAPQVTGGLGLHYLHETGLFAGFDATWTSSYYSAGDLSNNPAVKVNQV